MDDPKSIFKRSWISVSFWHILFYQVQNIRFQYWQGIFGYLTTIQINQ